MMLQSFVAKPHLPLVPIEEESLLDGVRTTNGYRRLLVSDSEFWQELFAGKVLRLAHKTQKVVDRWLFDATATTLQPLLLLLDVGGVTTIDFKNRTLTSLAPNRAKKSK